MSSLRASEVGRRWTSASRLPPVVLLFGADRGLVAEVSASVAALFEGPDADPFGLVKLDAAALASDPSRLLDEAHTVSLFGDRRLVLVRDAGTRNLTPSVAPLLKTPPTDTVVVVEAGDLKRGTGLRKLVEDDATAVAVHCPPDGEADLARMIDEVAAEVGVAVEPTARAALAERLGADRVASRSETLKACLHALDGGMLTLADVDAVVADLAVGAVGEAVDAAFLGQRGTLDRLLARVLRHDPQAGQLFFVAQRTAHALEVAAGDVAAGTAPIRAVEVVRPPLYGARKEAAARALERWTVPRLRRACEALADATFAARVTPQLAAARARDVMWRIACEASRR